ncbi:MAG: amylo-alpha-1,6-glucosidase, partial [Gammaproteobacteria bacterium]
MEDAIQTDDRWDVLATSSYADDRTRVLKYADTFAVFDRYGNIQPLATGEHGLYHEGTRFLSNYELRLNEHQPILLNSTVKEDNSLLTVDLTTPDFYEGDKLVIPKDTLHVFRGILLWEGVHYEHLRIMNYGDQETDIDIELRFQADYADIFEVRGHRRKQRGRDLPVRRTDDQVTLGYVGLDGVTRRTRILFKQAPDQLEDNCASFSLQLPPRKEKNIFISIACDIDSEKPAIDLYDKVLSESVETMAADQQTIGSIYTSNEQFNDWINRSAADLAMLGTETKHGTYPYAGVPWFSTPFGRDGIITALQYLWMKPELAQGVLKYLAATQAHEENPQQDAEPGKILHETRKGEMASLGEVPFRRYYGSVDATPLFIVLAGAYYRRTGDHEFVETIWPNITRALEWIDRYGDCDGDGFVEYARHSVNGLVQQGWKDSNDSVFHHDGSPAKGPIALCEVQGYVYEAKLTAAELATLFGDAPRAAELKRQAEKLKQQFNQAFWCEDIGTFAIALDGDKSPCRVRSSNAGHALFSGIANPEYAHRVSETLVSDISFSGWGVRTIANTESRYNPMSYHNGSIWPHDNSIIAIGLARYGFKEQAMKILTGLFNASIVLDLHRLPELMCGFDLLQGQGPTLYPVACAPQAWASGSVFYLLQACLGLTFSSQNPQLTFHHPQLPDYLDWLKITNLHVGDAVLDLELNRHELGVS